MECTCLRNAAGHWTPSSLARRLVFGSGRCFIALGRRLRAPRSIAFGDRVRKRSRPIRVTIAGARRAPRARTGALPAQQEGHKGAVSRGPSTPTRRYGARTPEPGHPTQHRRGDIRPMRDPGDPPASASICPTGSLSLATRRARPWYRSGSGTCHRSDA